MLTWDESAIARASGYAARSRAWPQGKGRFFLATSTLLAIGPFTAGAAGQVVAEQDFFAAGQNAGVAGQEAAPRSWNVSVWLQSGYLYPSGKFGKNSASDIERLGIVEAVAELGPAALAGVGVEVFFPGSGLSVRLGWETTFGMEATGRLSLCALVEGTLCRQEVAPVDLRGFVSRVRFLRGDPDQALRPVISGGAGLRQYTFSVPSCSDRSGDPRIVCNTITDIFQEAGSHIMIRGGVGLEGRFDRVVAELVGSTGVGRYAGGASRAGGTYYVDLRIELSAGFRVF